MGLFDGTPLTPEQEGLLATALGLLTARQGDGSAQRALLAGSAARNSAIRTRGDEEQRKLQMEQQRMQMEQMRQQQAQQAQMQGLAQQHLSPQINPDGMGPARPPDFQGFAQGVMGIDPMKGIALQQQLQPPKPEAFTLGPGQRRYVGGQVVAEGAPEGQKVGTIREIKSGGNTITYEWNGQKWEKISSAPTHKPDGPEKPDKPPQGYRVTADGNLAFIPGGPADPSVGKKEAAPTEDERRSAGLAIRMNSALKAMQEKPDSMKPEKLAETVRAVTGGRLEALPNALTSSNRQQVEAAQLDALDAALTLATGAAYTKEQLQNLRKSYFPQLGDSKETEKAKAEKLAEVIQTARIRAGRAEGSIDQVSAPAQGVTGGDTKKVSFGGRMMDAKKAPDGNYYIQSGGKYYRVEDR